MKIGSETAEKSFHKKRVNPHTHPHTTELGANPYYSRVGKNFPPDKNLNNHFIQTCAIESVLVFSQWGGLIGSGDKEYVAVANCDNGTRGGTSQ